MEHSVATIIDTASGKMKDDEESNDKMICDSEPVVYQLVRVEGDGRLVPATDDEVMEVEQLLEDKKSELTSVKAVGHDEQCLSNEVFSKSNLEGTVQSGNADNSRKLNARLENIKVMLKKVKKEERLLLSGESLNCSPKCMAMEDPTSDRSNTSKACIDKHEPENPSRERAESSPELNSIHIVEVGTIEACSGPTNKAATSRSSISESCSSLLPDFSILRGEICLDDFSIRELQEAFRATFGRQTSVKDKLWLKRRIAMGLTNSCHVPTARFTIKDNKIILSDLKEPARLQQSMIEAESLSMDIHATNVSPRDIKNCLNNQMEFQQVSGKRLRVLPSNDDVKDENIQMEQCAAKRMRKPTKRYIEELSELETRECTAKSYYCVNSEQSQFTSKAQIMPFHDGGTHIRLSSTRHESLRGFSFQVPFVLRARRGQPRKNLMALMEYHPNAISSIVKTAVMIPVLEEDKENGSSSRETRSVPVQILNTNLSYVKIVASEEGVEMDCGTLNCEELDPEHKKLDGIGDTACDNVPKQPAAKANVRRKHHRAWTLCEIRKLVDGVAKYGAGRWSEIRRLSFASYSYRTSVDLKDKWRNLLRASLVQCPTEKEVGILSRFDHAFY
ncbi:Myb-like DNA-binding domain [Musa troglodytarum]|uniref:Myb-like DNA-binding domain n=1 Tax=Musa troglodytarum TaxID=320322 RepID=A0A9E7FY07_9LILI|nr:Myb-like DNA-binding domain [Musa troglodytarum]